MVFTTNDWKTTLLPVDLKAYYPDQELAKNTRSVHVIHNMVQPTLDGYNVSILAYGQTHFERTHIMEELSYGWVFNDLFLFENMSEANNFGYSLSTTVLLSCSVTAMPGYCLSRMLM